MSLANTFVWRFKVSKDKERLRRRLREQALTCVQMGDDLLYTLPDGSTLLERPIVGEWQVFKGEGPVDVIMSEGLAMRALREHPELAAKMAIKGHALLVYRFAVSFGGILTTSVVSREFNMDRYSARDVLNLLVDRRYMSRATSNLRGHSFVYSVLRG